MNRNWMENDAALAAMINLIVVLADNKYYLGRRLSEWAVGAPSLEGAVAAAALTQEELGHARALYPLLEELPFPGRAETLEREKAGQRRYAISFLLAPWPSWSHAVAALVLTDVAITTMLEHLAESNYAALARRAARILQEEAFHLEYAEGRVRDLAATEEGRRALAGSIESLFPEMMLWFGPQGEPGVKALRQEALIAGDNETWRQSYLARIMPLLLETGVQPSASPQWDMRRRRWEYEEPPWQNWDPLERRLKLTRTMNSSPVLGADQPMSNSSEISDRS